MSQFTAPLLVTPLDDGKSWVIVSDDFKYDVGREGSGNSVEVPQWLVTDFASVPRAVWWFAAPWGRHGHAAVVHDAGYYRQDRTRREYDHIFREAMEVLGVRKVKRTLMYLAVRWFGGWAWSTNARRKQDDPHWKMADPEKLGLVAAAAAEAGPVAYDRANAPGVDDVRQAVDAKRQA